MSTLSKIAPVKLTHYRARSPSISVPCRLPSGHTLTPLRPMTYCEINRTAKGKEPRVAAGRGTLAPVRLPEGVPMPQKHRRSNREPKKPKQQKPKVVVSTSPFGSANANLAKPLLGKSK